MRSYCTPAPSLAPTIAPTPPIVLQVATPEPSLAPSVAPSTPIVPQVVTPAPSLAPTIAPTPPIVLQVATPAPSLAPAIAAVITPSPVVAVQTPPLLTTAKVAEIETSMKIELKMDAGYGIDCNPCYLGDLYGAILRLAFHDSVGEESRLNGCVDLTVADHNGLQEIIGQLQLVWNKVGGAAVLSFADLTAIATKVAVEMSTTVGGAESVSIDSVTDPLMLPLLFGRIDSSSCNDEGILPTPSFTWSQTTGLFNAKFGLSDTESVALMGAHALGRAELTNTGVSDMGWTAFQSSFGNKYYTDMIDIGWGRHAEFDVYQARNTVHLLHADIEMAIAPSIDCNGWAPGPVQRAGTCPLNVPTLPAVKAFAGLGGTFLWWTQFESAFSKMVEANNPGLYAAL